MFQKSENQLNDILCSSREAIKMLYRKESPDSVIREIVEELLLDRLRKDIRLRLEDLSPDQLMRLVEIMDKPKPRKRTRAGKAKRLKKQK